jgi:hypothetical protein
MYEATQPLAWRDVRQYVFNVVTGNRSAGHVLRVLFLASLRWLLTHAPCCYRCFKGFHDWVTPVAERTCKSLIIWPDSGWCADLHGQA